MKKLTDLQKLVISLLLGFGVVSGCTWVLIYKTDTFLLGMLFVLFLMMSVVVSAMIAAIVFD